MHQKDKSDKEVYSGSSEFNSQKLSPCSCRLCGTVEGMELLWSFGMLPVPGYLEPNEKLARNAPRYELAIAICRVCSLVQQAYKDADKFLSSHVYSNYQPTYGMSNRVVAYLDTFLKRALMESGARPGDYALEIGSNDGTGLRLLAQKGLKPIGFEPATSLARQSRVQELDVIEDYFGSLTAHRFLDNHHPVKLVITRHTLEHAFEPLDFLKGISIILAEGGMTVIEVPYVFLQTTRGHFEGMAHQHISFFSVSSMAQALASVGLMIVRVEFVNTDGGSMVVYARKEDHYHSTPASFVQDILFFEQEAHLDFPTGYKAFFDRVQHTCHTAKEWLSSMASNGRLIVGYGAGGKGQALVNMIGLDLQEVPYIIDDTPGKSGLYVPGTGMKVLSSDNLHSLNPDYIMITAPTHVQEIIEMEQRRASDKYRFLVTTPEFCITSSVL